MNKSMVGRIPNNEDTGPGSVGNSRKTFDRMPWVYTPSNVPDSREHLGECCGNPLRGCTKCPPPKKLTFEEWWRDAQEWVPFEEHPEKAIWQAAQENK